MKLRKLGAYTAFLNGIMVIVGIFYSHYGMHSIDNVSVNEFEYFFKNDFANYFKVLNLFEIFRSSCELIIFVVLFQFLDKRESLKPSIGFIFAVVSIIFKIISTCVSLLAIQLETQSNILETSENPYTAAVRLYGFYSMLLNSLCFLFFFIYALKNKNFPKALSYFGIALGIFSLIPIPYAYLLISVLWSFGIGKFFLFSSILKKT